MWVCASIDQRPLALYLIFDFEIIFDDKDMHAFVHARDLIGVYCFISLFFLIFKCRARVALRMKIIPFQEEEDAHLRRRTPMVFEKLPVIDACIV